MNAHVSFHGFKVPLIGIGEDEALEECEDCHDAFSFEQIRLSADGHFRCDKCTEHDARATSAGLLTKEEVIRQRGKQFTPLGLP